MVLLAEQLTCQANGKTLATGQFMRMSRLDDLAAVLVERGLIDQADAIRARRLHEASGERQDVLLARLGLVDENRLAETLASHLSLELVQRDGFPREPVAAGGATLAFLRNYRVLPLFEDDERLTVAMADPTDQTALGALRLLVEKEIEAKVGVPSELARAIEALYRGTAVQRAGPEASETDLEDREALSDAPAIRALDGLISQAVANRASDIHIEPEADGARVRYRIDGRLIELGGRLENYLAPAVVNRVKILARLDVAERRLPQDGRASIATQGRVVDIRVSTMPTLDGESVVLRLLDPASAPGSLAELGLDVGTTERLEGLLSSPHGLVLVSGPTGSGKTTTLYAMLGRLNSGETKILTAEDPVEYRLEGVNQIQANPEIGLGFAELMRSMLRQDPDIVMVGEIRDEETARIAVQAALTGHLVLSTVHTNDAPGTVMRLRQMDIEPYLLASALRAVVAQRLVRRLCSECKREDIATAEEQSLLGVSIAGRTIWRPVGCSACHDTGYSGRLVISECLVVDDEIRHVMTKDNCEMELASLMRRDGGSALAEDGLRLLLAGETGLDEVVAAIGFSSRSTDV